MYSVDADTDGGVVFRSITLGGRLVVDPRFYMVVVHAPIIE